MALAEEFEQGPHGQRLKRGYRAETSIRANVRDLALHDRLITSALDLGLNRIWGVTFESSRAVERHREARILAVRAAREKAEYLAAGRGHRAGAALSVKEIRTASGLSWEQAQASNSFTVVAGGGLAADIAAAQSLIPDSITVCEQVEVVFRLEG